MSGSRRAPFVSDGPRADALNTNDIDLHTKHLRNPLSGADLRVIVRAAELLGDSCTLGILSLRLAETAGWLARGSCANWSRLPLEKLAHVWSAEGEIASLSLRSGGRLPAGTLALDVAADRALLEFAVQSLLALDGPPETLPIAYELLAARARGRTARRRAGMFYTPPAIARQVVALALSHAAKFPAAPLVLDPCAGAGVFLLAAARALGGSAWRHCAGSDIDAAALSIAGSALALLSSPRSSSAPGAVLRDLQLHTLDALVAMPPNAPADLLVSNPPYGHLADESQRAQLAKAFPALRGAEIDLYAAFILRSLLLVRPGGCAALLVPDTWMTNARSAPLRQAVLDAAELRCVADLGKPFAAAKDTRVQAIVLVRREESAARENVPKTRKAAPSAVQTHTARLDGAVLRSLARIDEATLRERVKGGWQPYRSHAELHLCAAMERASIPLGELCVVGYGLRTGNNPLHVARGPLPEGAIPLCGGEDLVPFQLRAERPKWLREPTPELLRLVQKQRGTARVAIQRIRTNAAAPWVRWLEAAPVPPEIVCLDSLSTLSALAPGDDDLLHALLALCGSVALNRFHRLRTTDVNVKPSALALLPVPSLLGYSDRRIRLAQLSRARTAEANSDRAHVLEREIDREVYALYQLDAAAIDEAERGFWGSRYEAERLRERA